MRTYYTWKTGDLRELKGEIVREQPLTVYVNGERFITLLSTPQKLDCLVVGYLWLEKVIASADDIRRLAVSEVDGRAEVELRRPVELPKERILTSGCGGGITFRIDPRLFPRIDSSLRVEPARLFERMKDLYREAVGYRSSRGIHGAALADPDRLLFMAEDVGRHNAVDKVCGEALMKGVAPRDRILLNTGRISSEMLLKGARMGVPLVVSRTSPTEMAVALAEQLGITVVGYIRHDAFNLYAGGDALLLDSEGGSAQGSAPLPNLPPGEAAAKPRLGVERPGV
jgi:FdhD protein